MKFFRNLPGASVVLALAALLAGCASIQAPLPPSLELPKPPNDLRAVRKGDRVYLYWSAPSQTVDRQNVRKPGPTRICRSLESLVKSCGTPVGNVAAMPKGGASASSQEATFVDALPRELEEQNPNRLASYAVEAMNLHARSAGLSNQVQVALVPTLPPPPNFRADVTARGVVLTWNCETHPANSYSVRYVYRIYRKSETNAEVKVADVTCPENHYEDQTIEWQKPYEYRISVVSQVDLQPKVHPCPQPQPGSSESAKGIECVDVATAEGDDSPAQKVFTKDVYPPTVPTGLQAVFSGPGQPPFIDLLWAPDSDADLAGYNVYRREDDGQSSRINGEFVKTPAFRDANVAAGKTYKYSVSAVDERGNESAHSEEASENVPQP